MPAIKMTINMPDQIRQKLKLEPWGHRQATSAICKSIDRYLCIMAEVKKDLKQVFSLAELNTLFELSKGLKLFPAEDAFRQLSEKCSGVEPSLQKKLNDLDFVEQFALLEILEDCND